MNGEEIVNAIADVFEEALNEPQQGSREWFELIVTKLRAEAQRVGYSEWEDRMGMDL